MPWTWRNTRFFSDTNEYFIDHFYQIFIKENLLINFHDFPTNLFRK